MSIMTSRPEFIRMQAIIETRIKRIEAAGRLAIVVFYMKFKEQLYYPLCFHAIKEGVDSRVFRKGLKPMVTLDSLKSNVYRDTQRRREVSMSNE